MEAPDMLRLFDQSTFSDEAAGTHGDCNRACVATICQVDPETLPHPIASDGFWNGGYLRALREQLGVRIRHVDYDAEAIAHPDVTDEDGFPLPRIVMAAGPSPRGPWNHAVVWDRIAGRMVHDPHPDRTGLSEIKWIDYLRPVEVSDNAIS